jgi:hypothetical protein
VGKPGLNVGYVIPFDVLIEYILVIEDVPGCGVNKIL